MEAGTHCLGLPDGRLFQLLAGQRIGGLCCTLGYISTRYGGPGSMEGLGMMEILIVNASLKF